MQKHYFGIIFLLSFLVFTEEASRRIFSDSPSERVKGTIPSKELQAKINIAVEKGLAWLAKKQNENGSWTCRVGYKLNEDYIGEEYDNVAVAALGGMAFMAQGNVPGRGKYSKNVERALAFVLDSVRESDGYITRHGSRMYEHAFATLFLAEIYGMTRREDVKFKLQKAVNLLVQAQYKNGGWRYQPVPVDADISVTVSVLQALRAARNGGISVPIETINRAVQYVRRSAVAGDPEGTFKYQVDAPYTRSSPALTACGVVALMSAGEYTSREVRRGLDFLKNHLPRPRGNFLPFHYFYAHFYIAQAMYQAGGEYWENYLKIGLEDILRAQKDDGHWEDDVGETYATAMACLILQIPNEYLPIFQE